MTIPGYDPSDLDTELEAALSEGALDSYLTPDERARYENGEGLFELLSVTDVATILGLDGSRQPDE